jgi:hypothetical protein
MPSSKQCIPWGAALLIATACVPAAAASSANIAPVPTAQCGPGSAPETGVQGQVPAADRISGRSQQGYRCKMELMGQEKDAARCAGDRCG